MRNRADAPVEEIIRAELANNTALANADRLRLIELLARLALQDRGGEPMERPKRKYTRRTLPMLPDEAREGRQTVDQILATVERD